MRPIGFIQVDVDGLWAVRACYGKPENDTFTNDPCWRDGVPALADIFRAANVPATFFIVGRDLEVESKRQAAAALVAADFDLANHSYTHRIGMTRLSDADLRSELERTHAALLGITKRVMGFRAPGYDVDERVVAAVRALGYRYDASVLPTWAAPALRIADLWLGRTYIPGKRQFGRVRHVLAPRAIYTPDPKAIHRPISDDGFYEVPVGVTPRLRLPLTAASLLGLSRGQLTVLFRRVASVQRFPILLLHAIDGTDCSRPIIFDDRRPALGGFRMSADEKLSRVKMIVEQYSLVFGIMTAEGWLEDGQPWP